MLAQGIAAATVSGTGAIHLALKAAGVGERDIDSATLLFLLQQSIIYQNAIPVCIDSNMRLEYNPKA